MVVDAAGAPLAGAFVRLQLLDQRDFSRGAAGGGATTDAQGSIDLWICHPAVIRSE